LLTLSEVTTNTLAHINEAMIYSFCGQFDLAKSVIEPRWAFGYLVIYLVSMWDSYRSAVYQNKLYHLNMLKSVTLPRIGVFSSEIQYLERKKPIVGVLYSFFFPGLGQLYVQRFGLAFYAIFWWWIYLTLSGLHESLLALILGDLHKSTTILNLHWLLFMPSVMGGSIYHAYITSFEHNKLFRLSQRTELTKRYGSNKLRIFP
jgi:hypothetical protein